METQIAALKNLDEILNEEEIVIADSGVQDRKNSPMFRERLYYERTFSRADIISLQMFLECMRGRVEIFRKEKVITVDKVAKELVNFRDILVDKKKAMMRYSGIAEREKKYVDDAYNHSAEENEHILDEICNEAHRACLLAKSRVFIPEDKEKFLALEKIALAAAEIPGVKIDFSERYGCEPNTKEDLHTDERIVATAFYISMFNEKPNAIITVDSDIFRIAYQVQLGFAKAKARIERALIKNRVRVYYLNNKNLFGLVFDSSEFGSAGG